MNKKNMHSKYDSVSMCRIVKSSFLYLLPSLFTLQLYICTVSYVVATYISLRGSISRVAVRELGLCQFSGALLRKDGFMLILFDRIGSWR